MSIFPVVSSDVFVTTTQNRGMTPEEWSEHFVKSFMSISDTMPAPIRDQANAYREEVRKLFVLYASRAVHSGRISLAHQLKEAGHKDVAKFIEG